MDTPVLGGVILCPLCRFPLVIQPGFPATPLRSARCSNSRCPNYRLAQELSLYSHRPMPFTPRTP
jgi:hypothetical protein